MSVETFVPSTEVVQVTPKAVKHFEAKLAMQGESKVIRLSTKPSGCTGYAYVIDYADGPAATDIIVKASEKVTIAIAENAVEMLKNTEIDYVIEGVNGLLKFNNPNVVDACGCGESFSVA
ncbi:MAG: iron-sulfur cluster assembly protein SufA [Idiomarinaceae bacterium HL-53]|nr:MAG: iron-sulfur cluster assembly protein SufA [Idiomarinaceae bacterium HL-53]CUS49153.1 iron-sulfur cluster assembly protein [Idiomarinaceae bacterium HL-53]